MYTSILTVKPDPEAVSRRAKQVQELKDRYGNKLLCHPDYKLNPRHRLPGYKKDKR